MDITTVPDILQPAVDNLILEEIPCNIPQKSKKHKIKSEKYTIERTYPDGRKEKFSHTQKYYNSENLVKLLLILLIGVIFLLIKVINIYYSSPEPVSISNISTDVSEPIEVASAISVIPETIESKDFDSVYTFTNNILSKDDIDEMLASFSSRNQKLDFLQYRINMIYAYYGCRLDEFKNYSWYEPTTSVSNFDYSLFDDTTKYNLKILIDYRSQLRDAK